MSSWDPVLLLAPIAEGGREVVIGLCCWKKLDLRRPFAGDAGTLAIDSIVRSANERRGFRDSDAFVPGFGGSSSPTRVSTLEDALETDLNG
jgi:hypothetical protein